MDGSSVFLIVIVIAMLLAIPFAINAKKEHDSKLLELKDRYSTAKKSEDEAEIADAARAIIHQFRTTKQPGLQPVAEEIYQDALSFLKRKPDLKPFVLEVGRLAYGLKRKDKNPTVYDEQAIQNDINAHS